MTQRKRATGFVLMDAAFTADAKFVRLARLVPDPVDYAACVGVFWMLLADCRRAKSPEVDWDDYTDFEEQIEHLRSALLLHEGGFDPEPFERWAPAYRAPGERSGTGGNGTVRKGTEGTNTSGQVESSQVTNQSGANEDEPIPIKGHMGQHRGCAVCAPIQRGDTA